MHPRGGSGCGRSRCRRDRDPDSTRCPRPGLQYAGHDSPRGRVITSSTSAPSQGAGADRPREHIRLLRARPWSKRRARLATLSSQMPWPNWWTRSRPSRPARSMSRPRCRRRSFGTFGDPRRRRVGLDSLSQREFEMLRLLGAGMSLKECANRLAISTSSSSATYRGPHHGEAQFAQHGRGDPICPGKRHRRLNERCRVSQLAHPFRRD